MIEPQKIPVGADTLFVLKIILMNKILSENSDYNNRNGFVFRHNLLLFIE